LVSLDKPALALSDPTRLRSAVAMAVLDLAPSRLSYHMKALREARLVSEQKWGRWIYFSLNRGPVLHPDDPSRYNLYRQHHAR
jgi:DNA-binding transcriptional ArsR family regulator